MKKKDLLSLTILACFLVIFFYPVIVLQKTFITTGLIQSDLMNQNYPLKAAYGDALKKGKLLLWSSLIGNGYPVFAEGQTGGLYPVNLLLFKFLPNLQAYNFSLLIHYLLAGFLTYLFARKILKLGQVPGLLAAITYAFSGFFMTHLVHPSMIQVASFIPLNFLLVEKIVNKHSLFVIRYSLFLGIVFALQTLAGHHELLYFTVVFLFIYLLIRNLQIHKKQFIRPFLVSSFLFLVSGFLALGLSAIQILPTLELVKFPTIKTGLSFHEATSYLFPFSHLLTFVKPQDFKFTSVVDYTSRFPDAINLWETYGYVGIMPLILAGVAIGIGVLNLVKKLPKSEIGNFQSITATFTIVLILSLLLAFGRSTLLFKLLWLTIPGMRFFRHPTRFLIFTEFSLAILAGIGLEYLTRSVKLKFHSKSQSFRNFSLFPPKADPPLVGIFHYFHQRWIRLWRTLFIFAFLDLFIHNRPINPITDPKAWFQPPASALFLNQNLGHNRFHALRTTLFDYPFIEDIQAQFDLKNLLPADFNLLYNLRQTDALTGLLLSRHTQLNQEVPNSRLSLDTDTLVPPPAWMRIISLQAAKFLLSPIPFNHPALKLVKTIPFTKPLNLNIYLLTKTGQKHEKISVSNIYLYENSQSFPRTFIVPQAFVTSKDEQGILKLLSTSEINFKETVLLEEQVGGRRSEVGGNGKETKVEIIEDTNEKVVINTISGRSGFLVLADTFYPGWKAYIDGTLTKIYRANFNFRAIVLPKGEHRVEFIYKPLSFRIGRLISLTTGVLIVLFLVSRKRIKIKISNIQLPITPAKRDPAPRDNFQ